MTFSIVARCAGTRMFGVAIASSSPAVAARCAHARSHAGAAATQNITDPALGPRILAALERGATAQEGLREALDGTRFGAYRQLLAVGSHGAPAIHSGQHGLGLVGSAAGAHCAAAGNLLSSEAVPRMMVDAFEREPGHLGHRLLAALRAGARQGGEAGPVRSAGLLVVRDVAWPIVDLRVDWSDDPVTALEGIWAIYLPQIEDYVRRALDPGGAPSFGVPGNP